MGRYLLHDPIAIGIFNRNHNTGTGAFCAWPSELENTPEILRLLCKRMASDFEGAHQKMRKPYTTKDLDIWIN